MQVLAHTIRHLGDLHRHAGRLELAEGSYGEAWTLYRGEETTHPCNLANAIRPLAILKERLRDVAEATRLWEEAKGLYTEGALQEGLDECSDRLRELKA